MAVESTAESTHAHVLLTQYPWQVVESRVESVLWQEDGRVALVEKA